MKPKPTCLLADDEPILRARLKELLAVCWPELRVVAEAEDGLAALSAFQTQRPDVAFLDIRMPGMTGLELAEAMGNSCHIVFVTAYDAHAIAAFESGVVDYVLKPLEPARLLKVVERLKPRLGGPPTGVGAVLQSLAQDVPMVPKLQWIQASVGNQVRFIPVDEIVYFRSDAKYTRVALKDGEALIRTTIKELAESLDERLFWQTHRGAIVNTRFLHGVVRDDDGNLEVMLRGRDERLPVSQPFHHLFRQM